MTSSNTKQTKLSGSPLDVPIVHTLYQIYSSWNDLLIKFPKSQRYTLGETCQTQLLGAMEAVITAASVSQTELKVEQLRSAASKLDMLRLLVRLAKDCKCLTNQAYQELESKLHEAGRMLGGWLKSLQ
jgi:hypothetical protein